MHIQTEREGIRSWKVFMRETLKIPSSCDKFWQCISGNIYLYMHQTFDVWNYIVTVKAYFHYFYFCHQSKTYKKKL